jgi:hypothetical protein
MYEGLVLPLPPPQLPLHGFPNERRSRLLILQNPVNTIQRAADEAGRDLLFVDLFSSHAGGYR